MSSEPRSPGTRISRRHGTRRAGDVWIPGTLPEASPREGDGPGVAALKRLDELVRANSRDLPDAEALERPSDDLPEATFSELADQLAERSEVIAAWGDDE